MEVRHLLLKGGAVWKEGEADRSEGPSMLIGCGSFYMFQPGPEWCGKGDVWSKESLD